ncbi:hypothetical protein IAR55_002291 [Kwoniella newhampshirensis]|uniref:Fungal lipase-type domain-containing protein n=1 Tax=Kwoniella newhampshirensis TaxID=1651941 RepID=A0AAW0Z1K3_9TREE
MLLTVTVPFLLSITSCFAAPISNVASVLTSSASCFQQLPLGRTPLSRNDMAELGRLAIAVNSAYSHHDKLQPHPPHLFVDQTRRHDHRHDRSRHATVIVRSSDDAKYGQALHEGDMRWYISHTPSTHTLTLALSSLPNVDDLLELLASVYIRTSNTTFDTLVPLPLSLFPLTALSSSPTPLIHSSYISPSQLHGSQALEALLDLVENPPVSVDSAGDVLRRYVKSLVSPSSQVQPYSIKRIEIVGHGLGSAVGLLVALALDIGLSNGRMEGTAGSLPPIDVAATLFGLPRVGDATFSAFVNSLSERSTTLRISRITPYADAIPHFPERHHGLVHPASAREIWIGADPRAAYACPLTRSEEESDQCGLSVPLGKTSLLDHLGPYGGVWITPDGLTKRGDR